MKNDCSASVANSNRPALVCALLSMTWLFGAHAANAPGNGQADIVVIEEVVVTATRRAESMQDIPVSVTAFAEGELKTMNLVRAQDLADHTPGLNFQSVFTSANPQWSIRGVASNGFNSNTVSAVGIYVDEVYFNAPASQGTHLFDLERVEVLRGPQGTLYGMNTTGGAINFIPRSPSDQFNAYLELGYGNYDQYRVDGAVGGPLGERVSGRVAFSKAESDGYRKNNLTGSDQAFYDTQAVRAQLNWEISADLTSRFSLHYAESEADVVFEQQGGRDPVTFAPCPVASIAKGGCVDFFGYSDAQQNPDFYEGAADYDSQDEVKTIGGALFLDWHLGSIVVKSITAYNRSEYDESDDNDMSPTDFLLVQFDSEAEQWTQEFRVTGNLNQKTDWLIGLFYFQEDNDEFEAGHGIISQFLAGIPRGGIFKKFDLETESVAVFGELTHDWTEQLSFRLGLRWTDEEKEVSYMNRFFATPGVSSAPVSQSFADANAIFGADFSHDEGWSEVSGHFSVDYVVMEEVLLYASYTRGFRGGNFDLGVFSTQGIVAPEKVEGFEIGVKSTWLDQRLRFNASLYRYDYTDQQVTTTQGLNITLSNAAESTNWGGEIEMLFLPVEGLTLRGGLAFTDAEYDVFIDGSGADRSGNELENTPSVTINGLARYEWDAFTGTLSLQVDTSFKDDHFLDFSNSPLSRQDSYWLVNARAGYLIRNGMFELAAWVKNIGDEKYYRNWFDFAGSGGFNQYTTGAPRTYGVTAAIRWE